MLDTSHCLSTDCPGATVVPSGKVRSCPKLRSFTQGVGVGGGAVREGCAVGNGVAVISVVGGAEASMITAAVGGMKRVGVACGVQAEARTMPSSNTIRVTNPGGGGAKKEWAFIPQKERGRASVMMPARVIDYSSVATGAPMASPSPSTPMSSGNTTSPLSA